MVYILSRAIPIEGVIHKRALVLIGGVCRLGDESIEKMLIRRQFTVKSFESNRWFMAVLTLFLKYDLPNCCDVVENLSSKDRWRTLIFVNNKSIHVRDTQNQSNVRNIEMLSKRLCFTLHTERYKKLNLISKRNKKSHRKGSLSIYIVA